MTRTRRWLFAALLVAGCDEADRFAPIRLDTSPNCAKAAIDVLVPDLDRPEQPWSRVLAVALDEPGRLDFWALVEPKDAAGARAMVHVRNGVVDHTVTLADFLPETASVTLRPGPQAGSAWLIERGSASLRLWQFEAVAPGVDPLRAVSPNLGWFPGSLATLCDPSSPDPFDDPTYAPCDVADWHRDLAFIEGQPFLVSVAPFSPTATMYLYAGRLRVDLGITEQTQLEFFRRCSGELVTPDGPCEHEEATTYPSLQVMGAQQDPTDPVHHVFVLRDREVDRVPYAREAVGVALDLDQDNNLRGFVFSKELERVTPTAGPPSGLATDDVSAYLLHPIEEGGARVTRLRTDAADDPALSDRFTVLSGLPLDEPPEGLSLLQMPGDIALGWLEDAGWTVLKLFPDAPTSSGTVRYTPSAAVTRVESAGRGGYLVFKDHDEGPDLVQLRCDE